MYFCCESTHCTETSDLPRRRDTRCRRLLTSWRRPGVMSTPFPVSSRRMAAPSVEDLALIGCRDLQLFAVLCDGTAGQHQAFVLQDADDLRVAERALRIF